MNVKELSIPIYVPKLQTLLPRIDATHPKIPIMQADLAKVLKGYRGENRKLLP